MFTSCCPSTVCPKWLPINMQPQGLFWSSKCAARAVLSSNSSVLQFENWPLDAFGRCWRYYTQLRSDVRQLHLNQLNQSSVKCNLRSLFESSMCFFVPYFVRQFDSCCAGRHLFVLSSFSSKVLRTNEISFHLSWLAMRTPNSIYYTPSAVWWGIHSERS